MAALTKQLTPLQAERQVRQGSDIVVVPYSALMEPGGRIRMSVFTRMAAQAAAVLHKRAATDDTTVIAIGEHTYGTNNTSTTDLIRDYMRTHGVSASHFVPERPVAVNSTPQQIDWLQRTYGARLRTHIPILVGHEQHWPRLDFLCQLYGLPSYFVDSATVLERAGELTPAQAEAARLYTEQNTRYEATATRLMHSVAWLGPAAMTKIFTVLARLRSPTVVDVRHAGGQMQLYASHARAHRRSLRSAA